MCNLRAKSCGKKREHKVKTLDTDDEDGVPKKTGDDYSTFRGNIESKLDYMKEGIDSIK